MTIKIVIAEDDPRMRLVLRKTLEEIEEIKVVQEVADGVALLEAVENIKPDVVFVDVDMPKMDGMEAAQEIVEISPKIIIIFVTAYANYAQQAFNVYAFDYLLKPFKLERIVQTMERVKQIINERNIAKLYEKKIRGTKAPHKLIVYDNHELLFLDTDSIIMLTRSQRKTQIYLTEGKVVNSSESLGEMERRLDKDSFFRTHKGYIVNLNMLISISSWGKATYELKLANTRETALATSEKMQELKTMFGMSPA